jgi:hypothetical protein
MNELFPLPELLQETRGKFQQQGHKYEEQSQALESELDRIRKEIHRLEVDQKKANQQLYHIRRAMHSLDNEMHEALLQQMIIYLKTAQQQLAIAISQLLDVRKDLHQKRLAILAADPNLEKNLKDYREFESSRDKAMQSTPAYYRNVLAEAHEKMRQHLRPLLEIEDQLARLPAHYAVYLPFLLAVDDKQTQLFLALPVLAGDENRQDAGIQRMNAVENAILQTIAQLASHQDWTILDIERSQWAGFRVLTTLFEFSGNNSIEQSCLETMLMHLAECWPFQGIDPEPQITRIDWNLWQLGQERTGLLLVLPEREPEFVREPTQSFHISGLFTVRDITSWERTLRVVEGSAWTVQARRLRTMLIRLIVQGFVGTACVPAEQLFIGLPQPHSGALRSALQGLIKAGILLEGPSEQGQKMVSINPELLPDIQDLINRDVSAIWEGLTEDPE